MNIDEYFAQLKQESVDQPDVQPEVTPEETNEENVTEAPVETNTSGKVFIDGVGEVDASEVAEWKRGYMRTQDYTRKTQEVAAQRKEAEKALEFYKQAQNGAEVDPNLFNPFADKLEQIESELTSFKIDKEIQELQKKYNDFEVMDVLNVAMEKGFDSLEEAYFFQRGSKVNNTPVDEAELTKRIREQLLAEIEAERKANVSIISSNDISSPQINEQPKLTPEQEKIARAFGLSNEEYLQWS
jgi:uncharacterized protein YfcZ (UPF0381/DUF406 family)